MVRRPLVLVRARFAHLARATAVGAMTLGLGFAAHPAEAASEVGPWVDSVSGTSAIVSFTSNATSADVDYGFDTGYGLGTVAGTPAAVGDASFRNNFGNKFEVPLTGLTPSTHYEFRVRIGGSEFATGSFDTAPIDASSFSFVALGDVREGDNANHQRVRDCVLADGATYGPFAMLLQTGDLQDGNTPADWQNFFEIEALNATSPLGKGAPYLNIIPFFPARGNHDFGRSFYEGFFSPPSFNSGSELYYSFDYGKLHVLVLDTSTLLTDEAQTQFAEADLADQESQGYPRPIVVAFHSAGVSDGRHGNNRVVRDQWFPIFQEYGVDLVLQGHDHIYERFNPINGVTYVVTGGGGAGLYDAGVSNWTAVSLKTHNYVIVEVSGNTLDVTAKNDSCAVIDSFTIDATSNNGAFSRNDPFPGDAGSGGCSVAAGGSAGTAPSAPLLLLVAGRLVSRRRRTR